MAFAAHRHLLRAFCAGQRRADRSGGHQQTEIRHAAARVDGQVENHQKCLCPEHLACPLRQQSCDLSACAAGQSAARLPTPTITGALVALAGIVTLGVGAFRVMDASMSLGELIAAMMIVWRVLVPIQVVSLNMSRIRQMLATVRQINDVSRMGNEHKREMPLSLSRCLNGNILASSVHLSLGAQSESQLRGINLAIKAGEIVAITGPSGSGKSTLLKLIFGLYPQYAGTILVDGFHLRQLDPAEVRVAIGMRRSNRHFFTAVSPPIFALRRPMRVMLKSLRRWPPWACFCQIRRCRTAWRPGSAAVGPAPSRKVCSAAFPLLAHSSNSPHSPVR